MTDKRPEITKIKINVNIMNLFLTVVIGTKSQPILHLETHDYEIDYVNIDLCHQYGRFRAKYM